MPEVSTPKSPEAKVASPSRSPKLNSVLQLNQARSVRMQIGIIADSSFREGLINYEAYKGYKEIEQGVEEYQLGLPMLKSTIDYAKKYEAQAIRIYTILQKAVQAKVASEQDLNQMMDELVVNNIEFYGQATEIESVIQSKIASLTKSREFFDELRAHELIKHTGYLKLSSGRRISIPSERQYLEMSADKRQEVLDDIKKVLPEAEKHAANLEEEASASLIKSYKKRLDAAKAEGVIGQKTYDKYLKGIMSSKLDNQEREYWLSEFDHQMGRYKKLWSDIHSTLKGQALFQLKGKIDRLGYTELLAEFGQIKKRASKQLSEAYTVKLKNWKQYGVIGDYTMAKFSAWFAQQDLKARYQALDAFESEMNRYSRFWQRVYLLEPEAQAHLRSKINQWGYTDLNREYERIKRGDILFDQDDVQDVQDEEAELQDMTASARKAALESKEILEKQTDEKKSRFAKVINLFKSSDAADYETSIQSKKAKKHIVLNDESDMAELAANSSDYQQASDLKFSIKKDDGNLESLTLDEVQDVFDYNDESKAA